MAQNAVANPFVTEQARELKQAVVSADVAAQRELAEVQAAVLMARRFPRDPVQAMDAILRACTRTTLAQSALYQYARGGTDITGPSIRLAEAMAQAWSNLTFGIRELEQRPGESTMEAYCWDMETNVRQSRVFQVRHERHTRERTYKLTDPRDIYEQNANVGARRLRACILGVIPGDVVEAAVAQCEATLVAEADTSPEGLRKLVEAFGQFGVSREQIEVRCQRRLDAIRPAQVVQLRKIWASLRDEMSEPRDWFEQPQTAAAATAAPAGGNEALRQRLTSEPAPSRPEQVAAFAAAAKALAEEVLLPAPAEPERDPEPEASDIAPETEGALEALPGDQTPAAEKPVVIDQIKPVRLRRGGGWDWERYTNDYIAHARELPPERLSEFRGAQASMFDALRATNKELWAKANQALADYEREGIVTC